MKVSLMFYFQGVHHRTPVVLTAIPRADLVHSLLNCCRNTDDVLFKCHFAARRGLWPQKKPLYYETTARVAFQHNHLCTKFFHLVTLQSESYLIITNSYY